ncbi:MAG TPA: spermidine/putrescine ABC transporter ATP-binding protein, partial [Actinomycetota bacterium]|nr:spermidine/putrescine ABC transporter ATP-binding protein [Actinomycetota bacterium]
MQEVDVRLDRITKQFGDTIAVDDLSLDISEGEFFSLLGPSGCGKTTTLRVIGGFEEATYGTVYLAGRDVTDDPPYKRDVNTVFQSYALFPHLDVFDNVAFGLRRKKVDGSEVDRRVKEVMSLVDLEGFESRKPGQMSGGQQQRVALARALVNHPKVLLLDEPLGALDLKLRKQMQLELKRIQQEVGITFIYVTHDQEEAMTMSNRLAVMRHGRIEQLGAPEDVYENPATEFVAGFLGASNLLEGETKETRDGMTTIALTDGGTVSVPADRMPPDAGNRVKAGVRPEKVSIRREGTVLPDGVNSVAGLLRVSTYIGVSNQFKV